MALVFGTEKYWPIFAFIVFLGVGAYGLFVRKAWKKALRKKTDTSMHLTLLAIVLMLLPFLLLGVLAGLPGYAEKTTVTFSLGYGISIFGGFITAMILGQTYKTLPFIVWMHRYKALIGKMKTPLPKELFRDKWVHCQFYAYLIGYGAVLGGVLMHIHWMITMGCASLFLAAVCYMVNVLPIKLNRPLMTSDIDITDPYAFLKAEAREVLLQVHDPEVGLDIINMGLVYRIEFEASSNTILVVMTLTSRGCPMGTMITAQASQALQIHFPDKDIHVHIVWDPPWSTDKVTEEGRTALGLVNQKTGMFLE